MFSLAGRLLFVGNDSSGDPLIRFTIFDPDPMAPPTLSEPLSFRGGNRSGDVSDSVKAIMRRDENKDGFISKSEIGGRMKSFFDAADHNGDHRLDIDEVTAKLKAAATQEEHEEAD